MKKLIKKTFVFTKQDKEQLMDLLKKYGYKCEQAKGEADVHIGKTEGHINVISADSDMEFHLINEIWAVLSIQGNNMMIKYINVAEARERLKLSIA